MEDFVVVDLYAQYDKVIEAIDKKDRDEILDWLRTFGEIKKMKNPYDNSLYSFMSTAGILTNFRFDEANKLVILHRN